MYETYFLMKNGLEQMRRIDGVTTIFLSKGISNVFKFCVHIYNGLLYAIGYKVTKKRTFSHAFFLLKYVFLTFFTDSLRLSNISENPCASTKVNTT